MDHFSTETDSKRYQRSTLLSIPAVFFGMSALACLGFLVTPGLFIFLECMILFGVGMHLFKTLHNKYDWGIEFTGDIIHLTNRSNGKSYTVTDEKRSNLRIIQAKKDAASDICTFFIQGTIFQLFFVKNYTGLKQYVDDHFFD